ncbi:MAG: imidazoleglycerol-phosphate dehydratase HisB [Clostridia bacterium]|nr:imidazoleglycerol-phosphate dehydratase HisB [Clostridia bacterium]
MRASTVKRKTNETDIEMSLYLDGAGRSDIDTGCGFLDHMLTLFASHGRFDLTVSCKGDVYVDYHHTTEDIGIALGAAFAEALGDKKGIARYGFMILPMDEALVLSAVDVSGRTYLNFDVKFPTEKIGDFDCELVKEFFYGFVRSFSVSLHVKMFEGENSHHLAEAVFKSVARALRQAVAVDPQYKDEIPSTKGTL